jgi:hypothetical protein
LDFEPPWNGSLLQVVYPVLVDEEGSTQKVEAISAVSRRDSGRWRWRRRWQMAGGDENKNKNNGNIN